MPTIFCPQSTPCENPANPRTNYSSELPDKEVFLGLGSASPIDTPNPGQINGNPWGYFYCSSTISQDAADLCGYNGAVDNTVNSGGTSNDPPPNTSPDTGAGNQVFWNDAQTATVNCPDGGSFSYSVPAMSVRASSLSYANTIALSLAKKLANKYLICISNISGACLGDEYDQFIKASTQTAGEVDWQFRSGVMPPGLAFLPDLFNSRQISISGTPTVAGNYLFVLRATDSLGNFTDKTFNLAVLGFTNSPTAATVATPYSFQFTAAGGTAPYTFSVPPANLPDGLVMSDSGLITGTPTDTTPTTFTVSVESSEGQLCEKQFTMTPNPSGPPARLRIKTYVDGLLPVGGSTVVADPAWDGTMPIFAFGAWQADFSTPTSVPNNCFPGRGLLVIATVIFTGTGPGQMWACQFGVDDPSTGCTSVWSGNGGADDPLDPTGTYIAVAPSSLPSVVIESY